MTAQNTLAVDRVEALTPNMVAAQIDAVLSDIGAGAVKTGMLATGEIIETVADRLRHHGVDRLVVDPVLAATSGRALLEPDALEALKRRLLPLALVLTPNLPEASALTGCTDPQDAARAVHDLGARWIVVKGGHAGGESSDDLLFDGHYFEVLRAARIHTPHTHGTGCTLSAAITAGLAKGHDVPTAVAEAKVFVTAALTRAYRLGAGNSPLHHFFEWWQPPA